MKEALLYEKLGKDGEVICFLCAHGCRLKKDGIGICGVRKNVGGQLVSLNYDRVAATHADPIEKNPFIIFCRPRSLFPSPQWAAISSVIFVKIIPCRKSKVKLRYMDRRCPRKV